MAFGKQKHSKQDNEADGTDAVVPVGGGDVEGDEPAAGGELEGPFDLEDFDDPETAAVGRLDLGSVLIPMPDAGQVQVELNETGAPSAVWVITPNGRFTVAAYAAPKSAGLWREVASELAEALRKDTPNVSIETGPWGREVVGLSEGAVRFIGVDGYRWMIRCVVNGPRETFNALAAEARKTLVDTVVRRDSTPLPVRTPLPVQLPEPMLEQLRAAAAQAATQAQQAAEQGQPPTPAPAGPPVPPVPTEPAAEPVARRSQGSAMQQFRGVTGG